MQMKWLLLLAWNHSVSTWACPVAEAVSLDRSCSCCCGKAIRCFTEFGNRAPNVHAPRIHDYKKCGKDKGGSVASEGFYTDVQSQTFNKNHIWLIAMNICQSYRNETGKISALNNYKKIYTFIINYLHLLDLINHIFVMHFYCLESA